MAVSPEVLARWRKHREGGGSPKYFAVRPPAVRKVEWEDVGRGDVWKRAEWTERHDGVEMRVVAEVVSDTDVDPMKLDWLGTVDDQWKPGAISRFAPGDRRHWGELRWFHPQITVEEHRAGLIKLGYAKGPAEELAREYVHRDMERLATFDDSWHLTGVVAKVYVDDLTMGWSSVWGVESDSGEYFDVLARDEAAEAVEEARRKLQRLRTQIATSNV